MSSVHLPVEIHADHCTNRGCKCACHAYGGMFALCNNLSCGCQPHNHTAGIQASGHN